MNNPPPSAFLQDMYKACQLITILSKTPFEIFQEDQIQISAMLWQFNVLGEAVRRLQEQGFTEKYPEIPWRDMRAIRNRIVHGYSSVDISLMRTVSLDDVPKVLAQLENLPDLKEYLDEARKVAQEKKALILTGIKDPLRQEKILRDEIRILVRAEKLGKIPAQTWKKMTIQEMVDLIQTVPEQDHIRAQQEALEKNQLENRRKITPRRGFIR